MHTRGNNTQHLLAIDKIEPYGYKTLGHCPLEEFADLETPPRAADTRKLSPTALSPEAPLPSSLPQHLPSILPVQFLNRLLPCGVSPSLRPMPNCQHIAQQSLGVLLPPCGHVFPLINPKSLSSPPPPPHEAAMFIIIGPCLPGLD